jgi:hypothetical protein
MKCPGSCAKIQRRNPELCAKLFYEEEKNDRKLAAAAMLAAAASISEDVVREQQARKRKMRRPWPLLRGLAHLARSCRPGRHPFCVRPGASDRLHVCTRPVGEVRFWRGLGKEQAVTGRKNFNRGLWNFQGGKQGPQFYGGRRWIGMVFCTF